MAGIARLVSTITQPTWRQRNIDPVGELWLDTDEKIRISAYCYRAGVTLQIRARVRETDGTITYRVESQVLNSAYARTDVWLALGPLFLLSLHVFVEVGPLDRGECYVAAERWRAEEFATQTLFADYLDSSKSLSWPGSPVISSVEGPGAVLTMLQSAPPAGAEWSLDVPQYTRWRIRSASCVLTTAAGGVNRHPTFCLATAVATYCLVNPSTSQAAAVARRYNIASGLPQGVLTLNSFMVPLPREFHLTYGMFLGSTTGLIQAGDQWSAVHYVVEQWYDPSV